MRKLILTAAFLAFPLVGSAADMPVTSPLTVTMNAVTPTGDGAQLGSITIMPAPSPSPGDPISVSGGVILIPRLEGLPPGPHGFHLHANASCAPAANSDGKMIPALGAGGHFDPNNTKQHEGPMGQGHLGDLPVLMVDEDGTATHVMAAPHLTLADMVGHALVIHAGGDTYSDQPQALGGGGARIACGVIK